MDQMQNRGHKPKLRIQTRVHLWNGTLTLHPERQGQRLMMLKVCYTNESINIGIGKCYTYSRVIPETTAIVPHLQNGDQFIGF
jgi:hypothetical protein